MISSYKLQLGFNEATTETSSSSLCIHIEYVLTILIDNLHQTYLLDEPVRMYVCIQLWFRNYTNGYIVCICCRYVLDVIF